MTIGRIPSVEGGIQPTIVDAKGDLIAGVAADSVNRLAVGSNDQVLVADSAASTGMAWKSYGLQTQNPVLNSSFQVWQRGTSIALSGFAIYGPDRWMIWDTSNSTGMTVSRQSTNDTTNLPNIQYCARFQRNSGQTTTSSKWLYQSFETINSIPFAGKTVTLSFYARAGANYSASANGLSVRLATGTGTDQNWNVTYTGDAVPISQTATLTSTWQRFSYTGTIAATATELSTIFGWTSTGTAGANDYFEITGVQLEVGSVATPYRSYANTLQGELAACQRYFEKSYAPTTAPGTSTDVGPWRSSGNAAAVTTGYIGGTVEMRVTKRVAPTVTLYDRAGTSGKVSRFNYGSATTDNQTGNTYVPGESCFMVESSGTSNNAAIYAHWTASAEL